MKEMTNPNNTAQQEAIQTVQPASSQTMEQAFRDIAAYGGFSLLESAIKGLANMNPERSTRKKIFLTEADRAKDRRTLLKTVQLWIDILKSGTDVGEMFDKCSQRSEAIGKTLAKNQLTALEAIRSLEQSYRAVMLFFKNSEQDKVRNITFMNASLEQLTDLDNPRFIDCIANELVQNYDRLDLRKNYSLLVIPGYLGSNMVVEKWAKIAYNNKVMLVTDFADLDKPDDVVDLFFDANLTGGETHRANAMMCCNWHIGRGKHEELGEKEHLHVPPSAGLAGKMYYTRMAQVSAGKKYGSINEVDGVVFPLKKSEISQLEAMNLIPMVYEFSKVMAFSGKTLFNGDDLGLQTYSVVRVFDYVFKVLCDYLNRTAFVNWDTESEKNMRRQIVTFLDSIKGPKELIDKFQIIRFEQDKQHPDRVHLEFRMVPFYPSKSFIIKMTGTKGDDNVDWDSNVQQE